VPVSREKRTLLPTLGFPMSKIFIAGCGEL
jgi:hypothetical protein